MDALKPITIGGGGLAGLTLGIGLRQAEIPVTLCEAGHYPRHRVCGEFMSGHGLDVLGELGLRARLVEAGASIARTAVFSVGERISPIRALPKPAVCLSRYRLDELLAGCFREAGGELMENHRVREERRDEGFVRATGRRLRAGGQEWRWLGLKVHARGVPLAADLEMHVARDGYVGLCRLPGGEVNICGLFRRPRAGGESLPPWMELLRGPRGTRLNERMAGAVVDRSSFCSVAGFSLLPRRALWWEDCAIGDALTMIPPVTGNGMSMAVEAAGLAIAPLASYSRGQVEWSRAREMIARACDRAFARRLAAARWLHCMMFAPLLRTGAGLLALRSERLWRLLFAQTR